MIVLAGDIGGTNTRLLCAEIDRSKQQVISESSYPSAEYDDLEEVIRQFLSEYKLTLPIEAACIAVAGPVKSGVASVTNLPWEISENKISNLFNIPRVKLVNDFVAVVNGINELDEAALLILNQGQAGNQLYPDAAVIGAGTGLGVAHRVWIEDHYQAFSSEAGHAGFAPANQQQTKLLAWLQQQYKHISLEMLLSGRGLPLIYQFFHEVEGIPVSRSVVSEMQNNDPAQVITENALSGKDELSDKTLSCFVEIYGAAAGDVALHYYPVSEVYIAGGIAPKIKDELLSRGFLGAFTNKGPMTANMGKVAIKLILEEKVGLYGALAEARRL